MSLTIIKEAGAKHDMSVDTLKPGTWFIEADGQIYVVVHDDKVQDRRVLCMGNFYNPFLLEIPIEQLDIVKILEAGTTLQIVEPIEEGFRHG